MAGVHSGDSACILPPYNLSAVVMNRLRVHTHDLARSLKVVGLMNIQYAVKGGDIYVLEVNPRASRTVPYVSKSIGVPLAKIAARVMTGRTLRELGFTEEVRLDHYCVKEAVLPFIKFPGVDAILGPEMKSTGEVMGVDNDFGVAFAKAQLSVNTSLPTSGRIFISVNGRDRVAVLPLAQKLYNAGFTIVATSGTRLHLMANGIPAELVHKIHEGQPNVLDLLTNGSVGLMINTPVGRESFKDDYEIRRAAIIHNVPYTTTIAGATAAVEGILALKSNPLGVKCLQEYHS